MINKFSETDAGKKLIEELLHSEFRCVNGLNCATHEFEVKAVINSVDSAFEQGKQAGREEEKKYHDIFCMRDKIIEEGRQLEREEIIKIINLKRPYFSGYDDLIKKIKEKNEGD